MLESFAQYQSHKLSYGIFTQLRVNYGLPGIDKYHQKIRVNSISTRKRLGRNFFWSKLQYQGVTMCIPRNHLGVKNKLYVDSLIISYKNRFSEGFFLGF